MRCPLWEARILQTSHRTADQDSGDISDFDRYNRRVRRRVIP